MLKYIYSSLVILCTFFVGSHIESIEASAIPNVDEDDDNVVENLHPAFKEFNTLSTNIYISDDGTDYVIETTGLPDHETVYWGEGSKHYKKEDFVIRDNKTIPNSNNSHTLIIDATPNMSGKMIDTELNTIGIAVSGVSIFNHQDINGSLEDFMVSFDWSGGRMGSSLYHYNFEPKAITNDDDKLVGVLKDGIFIYGRKCSAINDYPKDLDVSGGHFGPTQHNNKGEYHYHIKNKTFGNTNSYVIFEGPYQGF